MGYQKYDRVKKFKNMTDEVVLLGPREKDGTHAFELVWSYK